MKRAIIIVLVLVLAIGFAAPHFDIEFARPKIERALERGLGRHVEVGQVHFNLFTGPGFTVDDVTIHEDARAGIEPFAYVGTMEARVQLLSLFWHKLEFSISSEQHAGERGRHAGDQDARRASQLQIWRHQVGYLFQQCRPGCRAFDGRIGRAALRGSAFAVGPPEAGLWEFFCARDVECTEGRHESRTGKKRARRSRPADRP